MKICYVASCLLQLPGLQLSLSGLVQRQCLCLDLLPYSHTLAHTHWLVRYFICDFVFVWLTENTKNTEKSTAFVVADIISLVSGTCKSFCRLAALYGLWLAIDYIKSIFSIPHNYRIDYVCLNYD